jgi:dihydrofolate synthase / folylpolyglutamate synthase
MTYRQTLDYLFAQLPMFHRLGPAAYKANLDNTIALAEHFGNPERKFKSIHIAGTNGKGSVSHMLASVFQEAGYKTGLCTSPHLKDFRERFRVNGQMIPKRYVSGFVTKNMDLFDKIKPSFFEMTIAMAFKYFAESDLDIAIIETGLGGRLDSTNIITPEVSVITNISLDHTNLLGNTIEKIAWEKAGIIKDKIPVVIGNAGATEKDVFLKKAKQCKAPVYFAQENLTLQIPETMAHNGETMMHIKVWENKKLLNIYSPLTATYQVENILSVLRTIRVVNQEGRFKVDEFALLKGIENVMINTGFAGRWQVLGNNPLIICDTGHNPAGIAEVVKNIISTPHDHLHFVIGMMNDKEIKGILELLPVEKTTYYFCKPDIPRGLDPLELHKEAGLFGLHGKVYPDVMSAFRDAKRHANPTDLVFAGGSTFVVAEII